MPIERTLPQIGTSLLKTLAGLWLTRCGQERLPSRAEFSDEDLRPYFGHMLIVDAAEVLHKFRLRLLGTSLAEAVGREFTGKYFEDTDISGYEPDVRDDYHQVARSREPLCKIRTFQPRAGALPTTGAPTSACCCL